MAPESRVHDLRRAFAVLSLRNGGPIKTVQHNPGHATAAFTLDVYGHVPEEMERVRRMNSIRNWAEEFFLIKPVYIEKTPDDPGFEQENTEKKSAVLRFRLSRDYRTALGLPIC